MKKIENVEVGNLVVVFSTEWQVGGRKLGIVRHLTHEYVIVEFGDKDDNPLVRRYRRTDGYMFGRKAYGDRIAVATAEDIDLIRKITSANRLIKTIGHDLSLATLKEIWAVVNAPTEKPKEPEDGHADETDRRDPARAEHPGTPEVPPGRADGPGRRQPG